MSAPEQLPDWEALLRAVARLQGVLPDATLVGGTAAALHVGHRRSMDADHVIGGLVGRFDAVLADLEARVGWRTTRDDHGPPGRDHDHRPEPAPQCAAGDL